MSVDRAEEQKLENMMTTAEKTGNWEQVSQELSDRRAGNFAGREKDLADTVKAAADYCNKHGFPMTVIEGLDGHVQGIKDEKNSTSGFFGIGGRNVGVTENAGGNFEANNKL